MMKFGSEPSSFPMSSSLKNETRCTEDSFDLVATSLKY